MASSRQILCGKDVLSAQLLCTGNIVAFVWLLRACSMAGRLLSIPLHLSAAYQSKSKQNNKEEPFSPTSRNWSFLSSGILALSTSEGQEMKISLLGPYKYMHIKIKRAGEYFIDIYLSCIFTMNLCTEKENKSPSSFISTGTCLFA